MRRTWFLFLLLLVFPLLGIFAQEEEEPPEENPEPPISDSNWDDYNLGIYLAGDKAFSITLGLLIPTVITGKGMRDNDHGLSLGGTGTLSFSYFLSSRIFVGGGLSGMFMGTRAKNMFYIIPMGVHVGWQYVYRRMEFPLTFMIGWAAQKYIDYSYGGLFLKPGVSAFWRFNPDWSFGFNSMWWWVPQWPKNGRNAYGNFLELTLTARYHF